MTPTEWKFFESVLELACQYAYAVGHEDGERKLKPKPEQFRITPNNRMTLRTALQKAVEKR